jgi:3-ketosteroid 9alpha-monooxygenase subunit A
LPDFPEWDDPAWARWEGLEYLCDLNHPIEIFDNMSDVAHLGHLHGGHAVSYENEYEGHLMHQRQRSRVDDQSSGLFGDTYATISGYVGPGIAFGRFVEMNAIQLICVTPIEDGTCRLWQTAMIRSPSGEVDDTARAMQTKASALFGNGLLRDGEIWRSKRAALSIMQLPSDGPFRQSRTWYSQFYNPRRMAAEIVGQVAGKHFAKGWPPFTPAEMAES